MLGLVSFRLELVQLSNKTDTDIKVFRQQQKESRHLHAGSCPLQTGTDIATLTELHIENKFQKHQMEFWHLHAAPEVLPAAAATAI